MATNNTSRNSPDRMDLPFVGLATFAGQPACPDWDKLDGADVAVLGVPIDTASSYRVGTRSAHVPYARFECFTASDRTACSISRMKSPT